MIRRRTLALLALMGCSESPEPQLDAPVLALETQLDVVERLLEPRRARRSGQRWECAVGSASGPRAVVHGSWPWPIWARLLRETEGTA